MEGGGFMRVDGGRSRPTDHVFAHFGGFSFSIGNVRTKYQALRAAASAAAASLLRVACVIEFDY